MTAGRILVMEIKVSRAVVEELQLRRRNRIALCPLWNN